MLGDVCDKVIVFLDHFSDLPDPRQQGKVFYPLDEVLLLLLLAVLAGAETITDIAIFGEKKLDFLRRFRPFAHGTPSHDQIGTILSTLDAEQFQQRFVAWVASLIGVPTDVIAIDGKSLRRTSQKKGAKAAVHIVSAFATRQRLVLGQVKVADKSNEIVAIPKLLDMLSFEGAVVTLDAMGCQRSIASKIIDKKADYILALKGNQGTLHDDVKQLIEEKRTNDINEINLTEHTTVDSDHGRIETRKTTVFDDIDRLKDTHQWPGLQAVVMVESQREIGEKIENETRLYITSLTQNAVSLGAAIRSHWGIENSLHWILDMVFRDDECRLRSDHAPANFTTIKHIAHNLCRRVSSKVSMRLRRKIAAWDDDFLASLIAS